MEIVKYNVNEAEIAKLSDIYMNLTIKDLDDTEGLEAVHSGRMVMVKHRTSIDKLRKRSNEDAQTFIKTNNTNAKKLLALMEPIETHLKTEEDKITKEKERIRAEKEKLEMEKNQKRVDDLFAVGVVLPYIDVAMLSDEDFAKLLVESTVKHNEKLQLLEVERKAKEAEEKKLAEERAELEKIKKEQTEKEEKLVADREAIEAEKQAIQDRKDREAFEKDTKIQAEKFAKEEVEREAKEKKDKEQAEIAEKARQEALRPDKEKLLLWVDAVISIPEPELISDESKGLLNGMIDAINQSLAVFTSKIKEL